MVVCIVYFFEFQISLSRGSVGKNRSHLDLVDEHDNLTQKFRELPAECGSHVKNFMNLL